MKSKSDSIGLIVVVLIIAFSLFTVIYSLINSNKSLKNNLSSSETKNAREKIESANNNSTLQEKDIDEMNVDKTSLEKYKTSQPKKETEIANYTSTLYDRDQNRIDNIALAISKINDKVIKSGEEFSFNNTVGPMDEEHGFKKAVGFDSDGNKIEVPGGGMCQISSTMYNAALIANLEITERHPHSRRVYYVPKDKDATIFYGSLDLKFVNNTPNDIKISASSDDQNVTIKLLKIEN